MLALLIGLVTVVIGCWLSDNCWSPDPEGHVVTVAWPTAKPPLSPDVPISVVSVSSSSTTSRPSSPESDWPLVEPSDGDSIINLWHHVLCDKNGSDKLEDNCQLHKTIENGYVCQIGSDDGFLVLSWIGNSLWMSRAIAVCTHASISDIHNYKYIFSFD
jgi:hypothetical protein